MAKKEHTVITTAEEIEKRIVKGEDRTDWDRVDAMTEGELEAAIAADPDEDPVENAEAWFEGLPPVPPRKKYIHIGLDEDIVRWFQKRGRGYQTRMNAVLRAYYRAQRGQDDARP